jgi:hypothetical protein
MQIRIMQKIASLGMHWTTGKEQTWFKDIHDVRNNIIPN